MPSDPDARKTDDIQARVRQAVKAKASLEGMRRSFRTIIERQLENAARIPDIEARKERLRKTKEACVGDEELLGAAIAALRGNGFRVILAKNSEAALKVVKEEVKGHDLVVKSKSNVTKELHLSEALADGGIEVIETDLGDRIVQLARCMPVHPTGPACHLTRASISELFSDHFRRRVSEDPMELTRVMRDEIADYLSKAQIGITGANAVTANEGAVVIVHNEGNAAKCAMVPGKHIIITTPEKTVRSLEDAVNVTALQTYLSTGKIISSYVNVVTGPSYTADIEKNVYHGMHGPKEVVVIFVDDGRLEAEDKEPQYCIGCGMCLLHCPTYNMIGPVFGSAGHMGGIGVHLAGSRGRTREAVEAGLYLCLTCGACKEVCPASIDTRQGIPRVRKSAREAKAGNLPEHSVLLSSVRNYDNPWQVPRKQKAKWAIGADLPRKGELLYFAGCSTSLLFQENALRVVRILKAFGAQPAYLGEGERCCGSTARKLGDEPLAKAKAEQCFEDFNGAGVKTVVTSCPGCSSALNHYRDLPEKYGVRVLHLSQFLGERPNGPMMRSLRGMGRGTYHDPCDLGRAQGIYDEPRRLLRAIMGENLVEMSRSGAYSDCCGSGAGVKSAFPELAELIALERVEMARDAGADFIVTTCPWCVQSLRDCQKGEDKIEILDLAELVEKSLSQESRS